jgi:hypothetical protein
LTVLIEPGGDADGAQGGGVKDLKIRRVDDVAVPHGFDAGLFWIIGSDGFALAQEADDDGGGVAGPAENPLTPLLQCYRCSLAMI